MRTRSIQRSLLTAGAMSLFLVFAAANPAAATTNAASAFGLKASGLVGIAPTPLATQPPGQSFNAVGISGSNAGLTVTATTLHADASGNATTGNLAAHASAASVNALQDLVFALSAQTLTAQCMSTVSGITGGSSVASVTLDVVGHPTAHFGASAPPNTKITLGPITLVVNEVITASDGTKTFNALHLRVRNLFGHVIQNVTIASATCGPHKVSVPMASGAGLALGLGLLGVFTGSLTMRGWRRRHCAAS